MSRTVEYTQVESKPDIREFFSGATIDTGSDSDERNQSPRRRRTQRSMAKTILASSLVVGVIGGTTAGISAYEYAHAFAAALAPRTTVDGTILAPGQAKAISVSVEAQPVPVATAEMKVGNVEAQLTKNLTFLGVNFPYQNDTIVRGETVKETYTIDLSKVVAHFNLMTNELTFTVPGDSALATEIHVETGSAKTVDGTDWKLFPQLDQAASLANEISGGLKMAGVKGLNASQIALFGGAAKSDTDVHSQLEAFVDLNIVTQVGEQCNPLVTQIPGFTDGIKANILSAVSKVLVDPAFLSDPANKDILFLMNKPFDERNEIIKNAKVILQADYKIGPDQANIDTLKQFTKANFFTTSFGAKALKCSIDKNMKLIVPDKPKTSTTPSPTPTATATAGANK